MKQVRKLPPEVCSAMRSGVTIPTPAQGVVELLLNSIDAKASSIAIRIDLKLMKIQVIDNGMGIAFSDLEAIGNRSVTSKCYTLEEYYNNLMYHGYRGEALASLCEMSGYLEIATRPSESDMTFKKLFVHGKAEPSKISDFKRPSYGTTVTINDFMFNMPVRRCRMKDVVEIEAIRSQVELIALGHPEISISLRNDAKGRIILEKHKSSDLLSAFEHLFGHTLSSTMASLNFCSDKFKINGYISKESYRHNDLQFIYINNKPIMKTKLHKLVSALLAKSSIIRCNGSWKNKPIPKNVPTERWLSFPSLEKTRKFAVFVLNITCPRNEYEISWDSRKSSIYFKDWEGILNCVSESIRIFLRTENLVDEEGSQVQQDQKEMDGKDVSCHIEPLCSDEEMFNKHILKCNKTIDPEVETWNMQGAIHGITAKRRKTKTISKDSRKDAVVNLTKNIVDSITPTFSQSNDTKSETNISVKSDDLNSVPPVVKFLEKIETPEFARLKITRGAYRLKMKEEEMKREERAKKLGIFKFPDKPKLVGTTSLKAQKCLVKRNNAVKVNTKQSKNKKYSDNDVHKPKRNINVQYTKSFSCGQNKNNTFSSSSTALSSSSDVELAHKRNCSDNVFQIESTSVNTQEIREEILDNSVTYDDGSNHFNVEDCNTLNDGNEHNSLDDKNEKKVNFLIPSNSASEDVGVLYNIGTVQNVENDSSMVDEDSPSLERNIEMILPGSKGDKVSNESNLVTSKLDLKCSKLKISEITLLSIPTPQSEKTQKCINCKSINKISHIVEGFSFQEDKTLGGTPVRDSIDVQFNNNVNQSYQGNASPLSFSSILDYNQSTNGQYNSNSLFSSFSKAFEEDETNRKSSEDLCASNLAVHSPYFFNLNTSVSSTNKNIQCSNKDLNKGLVNDTLITNSKADDSIESSSKAKQFFEIFEISALGVNKRPLNSSPYFKSQNMCRKSVSFLSKGNLVEYEGNPYDRHERKTNDPTKSPVKLRSCETHEVLLPCENTDDKNIDCLSSSEQIELLPSKSVEVDYDACGSNKYSEDLKSTVSSGNISSDEIIENKRMRVSEDIIDTSTLGVNKINCSNVENIVSIPINKELSLVHKIEDNDKEAKQKFILEECSNSPSEKANKEMNQDWCPMKNCEGKNFFVHIPSGFTSFNGPASENLENFYGMSKRFEFIPKGMSPVLNACSFWNHNLKSVNQFPVEHNYEWELSKKNNLKTVKWRNEGDIWNNVSDVSDILDIAKPNAENKAPLNCSSVPDLSYTCAKMSQILHEEKFSKNIFINIQVIGQLDNKFIVTLVSPDKCTSPHILGLFDQHAVHERIRLETLMKEYSSYENECIYFKSSKLEEPLKLELGTKEYRILVSFGNKFKKLGFHFTSEEDNWIEVQHVPTCLYSRFLRERSRQWLESTLHLLIQDVVQHIVNSGGQDLIFPEVLRDIINSEACKGAIKFGDPLTLEQCKELLLFLSSCELPFFCAHGRPSFVPIFDFRVYENDRQKCLPIF